MTKHNTHYNWYHKAHTILLINTLGITKTTKQLVSQLNLKQKYHTVGTVPKCNCKIVKKWQADTTHNTLIIMQYTIHLLSCNTQHTCYHGTQNITVTMQHTLNILPF